MASLSSLSTRRPVLTIVFSLVIVLFGIISYNHIGVREFPSVDPPVISVTTHYVGASPSVIESQITEPLEEAVNGVAGVRILKSSSEEGVSVIDIDFELGVDLEIAANDVRSKIAGALSRLPQDAGSPVVVKADASASPIFFISVMSDTKNLMELSKIAHDYFKERFQGIPGVSSVQIWGEQKYAMRLWIDPIKLAAYSLTPLDILKAVKKENVELPAGRIEGYNTEFLVRTMGRLATVKEFDNLVIKEEQGVVIRMHDIGHVTLGSENDNTLFRRDNVPGVAIAVIAQPGANTIEIVDAIYKKLDDIEGDLPQGVKWALSSDSSTYIRASINEVRQSFVVALLLVLLIIFAFLRDIRAITIPIVTIPISLIGVFFFIYIMDFTINLITMLGMVLSIGLVVDDAIVVLENIYSKIEKGMDSMKAAREGVSEVYFAVISTTVAVIVVFLPIFFLEGLVGRLFREFAWVVSGSMIISSFVALTLIPMMVSRMLRKKIDPSWLHQKTESFFKNLSDYYVRSLNAFMKKRWIAFIIVVVLIPLIYQIIQVLPSEVVPFEDRNEARIFVQGREGATFRYMDDYMKQITQLVDQEIPEKLSQFSITSPSFGGATPTNYGVVKIILKDPSERTKSQEEVVAHLREHMDKFTGVRASAYQQPTLHVRGGGFLTFIVQAGDIDKIRTIIPPFMNKLNSNSVFTYVESNLNFNKPELQIHINRSKANDLGISMEAISQTIQLACSGSRFGNFVMEGKQYSIIGQMEKENRNEPLDLAKLYVRGRNDALIQLDHLITFKERSISPVIYRYNRSSAVTFDLEVDEEIGLLRGIEEVQKIADEILTDDYNTSLEGGARNLLDTSANLYIAFLMALVIVYLVMAGQFESFKSPFIIMMTVPLALTGALVALWLFNQTLNIFSQIGIILLIGLVTKNAILIVEFANQRRQQGLSIFEAAVEAATLRFRPILMTSLSTIFGVLPIAFAWGAGAESRTAMGVAIVGGMIFASLLTLYIIPAFYSYFGDKKTSQIHLS